MIKKITGKYDELKKLCQRLEWWPEMASVEVLDFMDRNGISPKDLVDILNAYSLNPQYVFDRIYKGKESISFFEKPKKLTTYQETICFITCFNKKNELDEMNAWIDRLDIPKEMTVEKIAIEGAKSMCAGYNEAMHSSKARYKVYLHQDVRILNPYFVYEIVDCFARNPNAGLIGMLGAVSVPESGVMWQAERVGAVIHSESNDNTIAETFDERVVVNRDCSVKLVDGFLMVTCVDLNWRAEIFKGWDFYDASQSLEFINKGYEVVVPYQKNTWCLHDFGSINWAGYEKNRAIFVAEYLSDCKFQKRKANNMKTTKEQVQGLLSEGNIDEAYNLINEKLHDEITYLQSDSEYCVVAAETFLSKENLSVAFDLITTGLLIDHKNYELYVALGEYYGRKNVNQALLCFYQALFYCYDENDSKVIEEYINQVVNEGASLRRVSIVIVTKNQLEDLKKCINSIFLTTFTEIVEIVVVDNASVDGTREWVSDADGITYHYSDEDIGYVKACNLGMKLCDQFNDVLLLDADTVLFDNSLFYLMMGLYSDKNVGAIGGATNAFITDQIMRSSAVSEDDLISCAVNVNSPMKNAYETVPSVSDFAMLINRDALDTAGLFDERFSPDFYEDKDLCLRFYKAGFYVVLCFNSYIIKNSDRQKIYGNDVLRQRNENYFYEKWKFKIDYSNSVRGNLIELISKSEDDSFSILELGCALGATLNRIKRLWPNSSVYGIEYDQVVADLGSYMSDIIQGDVENMVIPYENEQFDYIICADVLEHLRNPEKTLERFLPYLKKDGYFIISIPNIRNQNVLKELLINGRFDYGDSGILDRTHLKFFTRDTAIEMLERVHLKIIRMIKNESGDDLDMDFADKLKKEFEIVDPDELNVFQYYFLAKKE